MKKIILLLSMFFVALLVKAQSPIPNGNFENWTSLTSEYPVPYFYNSGYQLHYYYGENSNIEKTSDAYSGNYAVKLTSKAIAASQYYDTMQGFMLNINPEHANSPLDWVGGIPINETPTGVRGYYKYNVATEDSATVLFAFSKLGTSVGFYFFKIGGLKTDYTLFDFDFEYLNLMPPPDSVAIGFAASDMELYENGRDGSVLFLDNISFKGVSTQPALLNGDFEVWQSQTVDILDGWVVNSEPGFTNKSTDAYKGNFALELITAPRITDTGTLVAQGSNITTGYWDDNCGCKRGGFPYSLDTDTLEFWYKYDAKGNDSAFVFLEFKNNGNLIYGLGLPLYASANYQYVSLPFSLPQTPDTLIVDIISTLWNTTDPSHIGSTLIIDELQLKSQPLTTNIASKFVENNISIYPNPASEHVTIKGLSNNNQTINIYNASGSLVLTSNSNGMNMLDINTSKFSKGLYFVKIFDTDNVYKEKLIIK